MIWIDLTDLESSQGRVVLRENASATRKQYQCQGSWHYISWVLNDEIHQWLLDHREDDYCFAIYEETLVYRVLLSNANVAMLFKLTWGGM